MIIWEELDEGHLRARAGFTDRGTYHSFDRLFYAEVTECQDGITHGLVEFYDSLLDQETGEPRFLGSKDFKYDNIADAQLKVEALIYQFFANDAENELQASIASSQSTN
jgi:hypothetical protein